MPARVFAMIIGAVLIAGAVTTWAINALPGTGTLGIVALIAVALRLIAHRKAS